MKTLALALMLASSFYLVRHMSYGTGMGELVRSEQGPFATMAECEAELANYGNSHGLECRPGVFEQ
jgi:hypothetical protein